MKELSKKNFVEYRNKVENKFDNFTLNYYSIYKMLFDDEKNRNASVGEIERLVEAFLDVQMRGAQ